LTRARTAGFGLLGFGIGYFLWFTPYGGLVLLPAAALGTLVAMPLRWWHCARRACLGRSSLPFPGREIARYRKIHWHSAAATGLCPESDVVFCMTAAHSRQSHVDRTRQLRVLVRWRISEISVQRGSAVAIGG
jgi:hypothetical protein